MNRPQGRSNRGSVAQHARSNEMQSFRILYFRESVLEASQEVVARDVLEAIENASRKPQHLRAEIWSDQRRVGEVPASANGF